MSRTRLAIPETFSFYTHIPVRITDLNYGGHVGNDSILSLIHEARVQFLNHHHFSELDAGGTGLIMSDVVIEFKNELFYGEVVKAYVTAGDFTTVAFDLIYKLAKNDEVVIALAKTGMVCYDYSRKKVSRVPEELKKALSGNVSRQS